MHGFAHSKTITVLTAEKDENTLLSVSRR